MTSTALRAEQEKAMIFISEAHEKFYYEKLKEVRCGDVYHKALVYCLGICNDTRNNVYRIYDFKTGLVKPKCLKKCVIKAVVLMLLYSLISTVIGIIPQFLSFGSREAMYRMLGLKFKVYN